MSENNTTDRREAHTKALDDLLGGGLMGELAGIFERMEWAEDEIRQAQRRHPARADLIWHSFILLTPTHDLMSTEFVYRSHCAELLDRVAAGQDTRPGTAAEVCLSCSEASKVAPLTETAAGLYGRMWGVAFPGHADAWEDTREHYEALRSSQIDDLENEARRKLTRDDRRVTEVDCSGMHNGEPVACKAAGMLATPRPRAAATATVGTTGTLFEVVAA